MDNGFILLSRGILDSDVFASQKLLKIWVWCLCKANFKDRSVPLKIGKGETIIKIKRGSFIFGRNKAEEELFIDGSTIYKSIQKLKEFEMIEIESNNQYSIITICNYNAYQDSESYKVTTKEQPSNNQVTSNEQPSNTTKNANNYNKVKKVNKLNIDSFLLSEIKISNDNKFLEFSNTKIEVDETQIIYFKTALWFQKLFIKNLKEKNAPTTHQENATYKNYVTPIRLMFDNDNVTQDQVKDAYAFLNSLEGEFWKKQILSTETLRKQIQKILIQKNTKNGGQQQFTTNTKKSAGFSIDGAKKTLLADAERKLRKVENNDY